MIIRALAIAVTALGLATPASAQGLDALLGRLGAARAQPEPEITAIGWVERTGDGYALIVTFEPQGAAKLVADPGITVVPVEAPGVTWATRELYVDDPAQSYFDAPPVLRFPFTGEPQQVSARIEYAWCLVDYQCLFGEDTVTAEVPRGDG